MRRDDRINYHQVIQTRIWILHRARMEKMTSESVMPAKKFAPGRATADGSHVGAQVFYSHKRGDVIGICKLCGDNSRLLLGHILPRWSVSMLSGQQIYNTYNQIENYYTTQDGGKEYLFCATCEQHLGEAENYLAHISRGTGADLKKIGVQIELGGRLHRLDQKLLYRAILGIFYKAHLSEIAMYYNAKLDARLSLSIKRQILADNYANEAYNIQAIKWFDWSESGALPRDTCSVSVQRSSRSITGYIQIGGMEFRANFRTQPHILREFPIDSFLALGKPWSIIVADVLDKSVLGRIQEDLYPGVSRRIDTCTFPLASACPCQSPQGEDYVNCCHGRWYPSERRAGGELVDKSHQCRSSVPCVLVEPVLNCDH